MSTNYIQTIKLPDGTIHDIQASNIPIGETDNTSTSSALKVTVDGVRALNHGTCIMVTNMFSSSSTSPCTLNVNNLGAKQIRLAGSNGTTVNTARDFVYKSSALLVFVTTLDCWVMYSPRPIDSALSTSSTNPVQNKIIATEINTINATIGDINTILEAVL